MVFKVVSKASPVYVAKMWTSSARHSEDVNAALDTTSTYVGHYKNGLVLSSNWTKFNPKEVRVALYKNNVEVHHLKFNADKDHVEWFRPENLISSSWKDLSKDTLAMKKFALKPNDNLSQRSFEISQAYGGCSGDLGWLLITTKENNPCYFEKYYNLSIIYSTQERVSFYGQLEKNDFADVFAVFIR